MSRFSLHLLACVVAVLGWTAIAQAQSPSGKRAKPAGKTASTPGSISTIVLKGAGVAVKPIDAASFLRDLIEKCATSQNPVSVSTVLGLAQAGTRIEVMTCESQIILEGSDECFFGNNSIKLMVPCKLRYVIDSRKLNQADIRIDQGRSLIIVKMPTVELDEPIPDREAMTILQERNPLFRSRASFLELRDRVLAEHLKSSARERGQQGLSSATTAGRSQLQTLLQRLYSPLAQDVKVIVD